MGTYSSGEFLELFGGLPEPGECYPDDPDAVRDRLEEEAREKIERESEVAAGPVEPGSFDYPDFE